MTTRRRRTRTAPARLVERRIGLLFAVFLVMLGFASMRTAYLLAFKGSDLKQMAVSQQVDDTVVPARRGTITDRHGKELAVSERAATIFATPYLVKDPVRAAQKLAPLLGKNPESLVTVLAWTRPTPRVAARMAATTPARAEWWTLMWTLPTGPVASPGRWRHHWVGRAREHLRAPCYGTCSRTYLALRWARACDLDP